MYVTEENEYGVLVELFWRAKTEILGEKNNPSNTLSTPSTTLIGPRFEAGFPLWDGRHVTVWIRPQTKMFCIFHLIRRIPSPRKKSSKIHPVPDELLHKYVIKSEKEKT